MTKKSFLVFDFGASNGRAIICNYDGNKIEMDVTHRFDNIPVLAAGTLYWDILRLYAELKNGIQLSLSKYKNVLSLGIDAWGADFGVLDKNGKLIANPVHYRDVQRATDTESLLKIIPGEQLFNMTGSSIAPIFDLFHLYSLKIHDAPEIKNSRTFLSISDIFNYFLTGNTFNEITRFTTSILYDQKKGRLADAIFDKLSLPKDIFPPILVPDEKIGKITENICRELNVRPVEVIAPATHDTASAVAGIPVGDKNLNWAFLSMGTWCCLGKETEKPLISSTIFKKGWSNEAGVEGKNLFVKNYTGLWVIQQCREKWIKEKCKDISWKDIDVYYPAAKPFKAFIDMDDPSFGQHQLDMPRIVMEYCRGTGQEVPSSIGEISRCIYESIVLKFRHYILMLEKLMDKKIELLHIVGGGTKNKLTCKWMADATGKPVKSGPTETTSMGNLIMQLKAAGEINSLEEGRKISQNSSEVDYFTPEDSRSWDAAYERYLEII
ncbi:MAG: FGGY-family carbohydrate kinase [Actinobacteria bacterium]|nr:FGGY-family carbohydrate kinase [Actinomycetota bacterium]